MENEKIAKEKLVLNKDHGSLNVVAVFDVIGIIATIIEIIVLLIKTSEARSAYSEFSREANIIVWTIIGYSILAIIVCIFVRTALLESGHKYTAVFLNLIFALSWPLEFVCAIIIGFSDLYKTEIQIESTGEDFDYTYLCNEMKQNYERYLTGAYTKDDYLVKYNGLKNSLNKVLSQVRVELASLNTLEGKVGLSSEQYERKNSLIKVLDSCKKVIDLYDVSRFDLADCENIPNKTQYYIEKSNELPLQKKEIFDRHKEYLDKGVYSNQEFEAKVAYLFLK